MTAALVVGAGSIGKRHLRNLIATGRTAAVVGVKHASPRILRWSLRWSRLLRLDSFAGGQRVDLRRSALSPVE